ncbi:MAG: amidohydrolase family protein [Acidobacteriota bacterium]|nr:amidohydrolase family protein [Acidobacteriota bacterium]
MRTVLVFLLSALAAGAQNLAVQGKTVYTMAGQAIQNGVVLIENGKISKVGPAEQVQIPAGFETRSAEVVTPGLVDAHSTVGLTGYLNMPTDQDELEKSAPIQPELRAIDAYDPHERLIEWVRSFGVTTMNTGHAPGALVAGQTMVVKTRGNTVEEAVVLPAAMVAGSLGQQGLAERGKSPGTRGKEVALLRTELIKAQAYAKPAAKDAGKPRERDIKTETFVKVLNGEMPFLITADRSRDIMTAIRLAKEFHFKLILDGCAECDLVIDEVKASGYPVILHPTMQRAGGETENISFETAAHLQAKGIPFALQSGFEAYVPKTRVILFEAGVAAANGLTFDQALAGITINAAKMIGVANRVGSLEPGKDGDVAMYDGDPFEYTTHCVGTAIEGKMVSTAKQ